jgi:hypothetical protein
MYSTFKSLKGGISIAGWLEDVYTTVKFARKGNFVF